MTLSDLDARDQERLKMVGRPNGYFDPELKSRADEFSTRLIPLNEIEPVLDSRYLVKGWLSRGAFSVLFGPSNVGKTLFALDLGMHLAAAKYWHGNNVPPNEDYAGPVVFIALEGGSGINNRIEAMRKECPDLFEFKTCFFLLTCTLDRPPNASCSMRWTLLMSGDRQEHFHNSVKIRLRPKRPHLPMALIFHRIRIV